MNVSNDILLNALNARGTVFTVSELLKENQQGGGGGEGAKLTPPILGLNFISSTVLEILRLLAKFLAKIRAINLPKFAKICLNW